MLTHRLPNRHVVSHSIVHLTLSTIQVENLQIVWELKESKTGISRTSLLYVHEVAPLLV